MPVSYRDDRVRAEEILIEAAEPHALRVGELSAPDRERLESRYRVDLGDIAPRVYWRITDNWLELSVRFLTPAHGVRDVKDALSRTIMLEFDSAGIGIASATHDIVALPPIELHLASSDVDHVPRAARATSPKSAS